MSLLAPLFLAAATAIGLPVLMHLIRRRPRNEMPFSSLMFLRPSPPRLTRRSRLENLPLLLLRALALLLLAIAFARPFFRTDASAAVEAPQQTVLLMIDTSASMRRGSLWDQALEEANRLLGDLAPTDRIALATFDETMQMRLGLDAADQLAAGQRVDAVRQQLVNLQPSWRASYLGAALIQAAEELNASRQDEEEQASGAGIIYVISDLQAGSVLDPLAQYDWPDDVQLALQRVSAAGPTNASMTLLQSTLDETVGEEQQPQKLRIRVSNAEGSEEDQFLLFWDSATGTRGEAGGAAGDYPVSVPAGQSRVVNVDRPKGLSDALKLVGDDHDFDNTFRIAFPEPVEQSVFFVGTKQDDERESLFHYLEQVDLTTQSRLLQWEAREPEAFQGILDPQRNPLVVLAAPVSEGAAERLRSYASAGGRVLIVLTADHPFPEWQGTLNSLWEGAFTFQEATVRDYVMLGEIDFTHPIFAPFVDPPYNDFTKIRGWSYRKIELGGNDAAGESGGPEEENSAVAPNVIARFDSGDPALVELPLDDGFVFALATGWQPEESQLALSTKFVPLLNQMLERGNDEPDFARPLWVGDFLPLPPTGSTEVTLPGEESITVDAGGRYRADAPGFYTWQDADRLRQVAVNLRPEESKTEPVDIDRITQFGVQMDRLESQAERAERARVLKDIELEGRQKLWQWCLALCLGILAAESLLSGLQVKRQTADVS